ncbi:metal ABC transporter ATP-binding protein [Alkalicoccus urumqiensis]|uniref:metal ABC transporter ATP-binding protein n=1 Tax=Alkalicoccus urumqiensis TaxID=1548213 RepID=UPI001FDEDE7B|nr:metal ABC transporter ATP-binding protein [Alkalicoccus urumqiensis]
MEETISVRDLSVHYSGTRALSNISFDVHKGKSIGIIGPNGAGKSTLLKAMLQMTKYEGEVSIFGGSMDAYRSRTAYVPQRSAVDWDFPVRVIDVVRMGRFVHVPWYKKLSASDKEKAEYALRQTGMEDFKHRQIGELSGGQQQRVFLARALVQEAELFFLDEPFVGIDAASEEIISGILNELKQQGKTLVVIHHDLSKVQEYFDELVLLNQTVVASGNVEDVFSQENMKKAYGGSAAVFGGENGLVVAGR